MFLQAAVCIDVLCTRALGALNLALLLFLVIFSFLFGLGLCLIACFHIYLLLWCRLSTFDWLLARNQGKYHFDDEEYGNSFRRKEEQIKQVAREVYQKEMENIKNNRKIQAGLRGPFSDNSLLDKETCEYRFDGSNFDVNRPMPITGGEIKTDDNNPLTFTKLISSRDSFVPHKQHFKEINECEESEGLSSNFDVNRPIVGAFSEVDNAQQYSKQIWTTHIQIHSE